VDEVSADDLRKVQAKVQPVVDKFKGQIGEEFVNGFVAEIEKARAAK